MTFGPSVHIDVVSPKSNGQNNKSMETTNLTQKKPHSVSMFIIIHVTIVTLCTWTPYKVDLLRYKCVYSYKPI